MSTLLFSRGLPICLLLLSVVAIFPLGVVFSDDTPGAAKALPNVLIVLVDDMGYGDAKCFNPNSKIKTPNINQLARQGLRFTDAHAPGPLCHMSRYGLMTGQYPFRVNVNLWRTQPLIAADQVTIASHLRSAGYRTAMVGKWHLGFAENGYDQPLPGGPVDVGFDKFFGIRASTDIPPYFYIRGSRAVSPPIDSIAANQSPEWSPIQGKFWRAGGISPDLSLDDVLPAFTDEAISVIDSHASLNTHQPLMLYLALPAPHTPWLPSSEFQGTSEIPLYGDFLTMVDAMVGRVLSRLDQHHMSDNTLVIFSSDNGPVWYPADREKFGHDSCGGLAGMKGDALEAGHRMPMIVRWPAKVPAGTVSNQLVCFTDLLATFAELTGKPLPADAGPDSQSFLPVMLDPEKEHAGLRSQLILRSGSGHFVVRDGDWKWINALGSGGFTKPAKVKPQPDGPDSQLYNLAEDLGETKNLAMQHAQRVGAMRAILQAQRN